MSRSVVRRGFASVLVAAAVLTAMPASARAGSPAQVERRTTSDRQPAPAPANRNATETRRALYEILDTYPPTLGRVLRLDPSLMTNPDYLASYPKLAAFLAENPDVPRNPDFYLERYRSNYNEPADARTAALRLWQDAFNFLGPFAIFCVVLFTLVGVIRYLVEYRRWARVSKVNAEVHNKILDRFGSNEELLAYVDSPAGRRFLEATPIAPASSANTTVGAPYARILWSVQIGVILIALGGGFLLVGNRAIEEVRSLLWSLAALSFCLGVGSVASAVASYALSRRLGLLDDATRRPEQVS
jgi:hypothetical protein